MAFLHVERDAFKPEAEGLPVDEEAFIQPAFIKENESKQFTDDFTTDYFFEQMGKKNCNPLDTLR